MKKRGKKDKIMKENSGKIQKLKEEYSKKLRKERDKREKELRAMLKRLENIERQKAEIEIEKYKTEQKNKIETELSNISNTEQKYDHLKKEYQLKLEQESKRVEGNYLNELCLDDIYLIEKEKYEEDLANLKVDHIQNDENQKNSLREFKEQLEEELKDKLEEIESENNYQIEQEKVRGIIKPTLMFL